jgi:hypothetical protein
MPIRSATPADIPAILPMVRAICSMHERLVPARYAMLPDVVDRYARWLPERAVDPRSVFLVAESDGSRPALIGSKTFAVGRQVPREHELARDALHGVGRAGRGPAEGPRRVRGREVRLPRQQRTRRCRLGCWTQLPKRTLTVADTMDLWINIAKPDLVALLQRSMAWCSTTTRRSCSPGKATPVTAGRHLLEHGPRFVVIKKGEHGACWCTGRLSRPARRTRPRRSSIRPARATRSRAA